NDAGKSVIISEYAATSFGWLAEEAIGKRISGFIFNDSLPGEVIGVIKDFYITPVRKELMPLIIAYSDDQSKYMVRLDGTALFQTRKAVDEKAKKLTHSEVFESVFMEDALEESYAAEKKSAEILIFFAFLAILIGGSGLYALSAYEGEQRIKELGVRKIMGASSSQLMLLLSRDFLKLIVVALVLAMPLSYLMSNYWLQVYAYRVSRTADIFIIASAIILLLGWLTILSQAWKASRLNPVEALRYE
ncbi:MAG TPA: FtsX-like permease family protein, partial [Cyclobacteriaceae bacterium]